MITCLKLDDAKLSHANPENTHFLSHPLKKFEVLKLVKALKVLKALKDLNALIKI